MKIAIGADHAGYEEKEKVKKTLDDLGIQYEDFGTTSTESVDYPDYAKKVADGVSQGEFEQGLLVCGSGTGRAIAANKVPGVRAAVAWNEEIARLAREHNDANCIAMGARLTGPDMAKACLDAFLSTEFGGGRHAGRVAKLSNPVT